MENVLIYVAVTALPLILPTIVFENVLIPDMVSLPVFITAPADATLAVLYFSGNKKDDVIIY